MSSNIQTCFRCDGVGNFYEFGEYLGDLLQCKGCEGKGSIPIEYKKCLKCNGKGKVFEFPHNMGNSTECPFCHDKGYTINELKKCIDCEGEGKIYQFKKEKMGKEFKCEKCNGNGYFTIERFKTIKFGDEKIMSKKSEEMLKSNFKPINATQDMKSPETGKINKLMQSTLVFQGLEGKDIQKEDPIPVGRGTSQKNPLSRENLNQILKNNNIVANPYNNNANNMQNLNNFNKQQTLGYSYNNPDYPQFTQIQANNVNNQQPNYQHHLVRKNVITEGGYQFGGFQNSYPNNNMYNNSNNQQYQFGNSYQNIYGDNNNTNQIYQQQNSANFTQHPLQQQQQMSNPYHQQNSLPNFSRPPNFQGVPFFYGTGGKNNQNVLNRIDTSSFLHKSNISPEFSKMKPLEMPDGYKKYY